MEISDLVTLVNAGFSKADIVKILTMLPVSVPQQSAAAPQPAPVPQQASVPQQQDSVPQPPASVPQQPAPVPQQPAPVPQQPAPAEDFMGALNQWGQTIMAGVQQSNLASAQQPAAENADDIIAQIINPPSIIGGAK